MRTPARDGAARTLTRTVVRTRLATGQEAQLTSISTATGVTIADLLREGIDMVIESYMRRKNNGE